MEKNNTRTNTKYKKLTKQTKPIKHKEKLRKQRKHIKTYNNTEKQLTLKKT